MTSIQEWVDDMVVEVPSCLDETVIRAVKFAIQEFFGESEAWRFKQGITLVPDTVEYLLLLPTETYVLANDYAKVKYSDGVEELTSIKLSDINPAAIGRPTEFAATAGRLFVDTVSEQAECEIGIIVKPTRNIEEVPDELADKYFEAIRSGALYRLKSMHGKDWTDVKGALNHERNFQVCIAKAKREAKQLRSRLRKPAKFNKGFSW